jgi:protein gp37
MGNSNISWCDKTWNVTTGYTRIAQGCAKCWAVKMANRLQGAKIKGYENVVKNNNWTGEIKLLTHNLEHPLHWKKPCKIFVNSMSDLFHEKIPFEFIKRVYEVMLTCQWNTFQVLTKRLERAKNFYGNSGWLASDNIWLGVSVSTQKDADENIPNLLDIPAKVRWVSVEPMLEEIELYTSSFKTKIIPQNFSWIKSRDIRWVVLGCESGANRRPCKIEWIEKLVEQCKSAGVPVFVKQMEINGKVTDDVNLFPEHLQNREFPNLK